MPQTKDAKSHPRLGFAHLQNLVNVAALLVPRQARKPHDGKTAGEDGSKKGSDSGSLPPGPESEHHTDLSFPFGAVRERLRWLWDVSRGADAELSKHTLEEILDKTQGGLLEPLEQETYSFEAFLGIWYRLYSHEVKPVEPDKDLSRSISNYFISSSHNTYLMGDQILSDNSTEPYKRVLRSDCRCIEIDVWNGGDSTWDRIRLSRSRSPMHGHDRHLSTSSLPAAIISLGTQMGETGSSLTTTPMYSPALTSTGFMLTPPLDPRKSSPALLPDDRESRRSRARGISDTLGTGDDLGRARSRSLRKCEPIVRHAHRFKGLGDIGWKAGIPFRAVCKAVIETAFITNDLPVIVSLEVHATDEQQDMLVDIMKEEWGTHLLDAPIDGYDPEFRQPRLEDLRMKILVKVKKPKVSLTDAAVAVTNSQPLLGVPGTEHKPEGQPPKPVSPSLSPAQGLTSTSTIPQAKIREPLRKLAVYTRSAHFEGSFEEPAAKKPCHVFSLDENDILKVHESDPTRLFTHNRKYMMRAYPNPVKHVTSTNPDPSVFWRKGVQMVALNMQTLDQANMMNYAMFEGERGWRLKPPGYRTPGLTDSGVPQEKVFRLIVTVLAGQHLPMPNDLEQLDPFALSISGVRGKDTFSPSVKCELHVARPGERSSKSKLTSAWFQEEPFQHRADAKDSDTPDWGPKGHKLDFGVVPHMVEELTFLSFKVEHSGQQWVPTAWACIRFDRLQQGYRIISLMDMARRKTAGKLLVKIEKREVKT